MTSILYLKNGLLSLVTLSLVTLSACKNKPQNNNTLQDSTHVTEDMIGSGAKALADTAALHTEAVLPTATTETPTTQSQKSQSIAFDSTKKYIYLSFDDGPQPGTMNVYNNLKALGIKGTFFMVGLHETFSKTMRATVDTIRNAYPQILLANHSYTHANGHYISFYHHHERCFQDFLKAQKSLDVQHKYIRLPGNSAWVLATGMKAHDLVRPVCKMLDSAGYTVIGWDLEWRFKRDPSGSGSVPIQSADKMISQVEYALKHQHTHRKNALVLLSHDRMFHRKNYADSLYKFMRVLKTRHPNYVFETVDHYPGAKGN